MKVFVAVVALSAVILFTSQTSAEEANTKDENIDRSLYGFGFVRPWFILGPYYAAQQGHPRPNGQAVEAKIEAGQAIEPQRPVVEVKIAGKAFEAKQAEETNEDKVMETSGGDGLDGFRRWFFRPIYRPILVGSILASQGGHTPGGNDNVNGNNGTVVNAE
ncbi:uncharacterized protein LOC105388108 [Plutella xylostella]|uniref:uncharacterized protein LOC105388108 n=1 Tax=Plutella xylostella TaxID=51655 RepID=UPI0020326EF8|nr:uncharacterized protein LOC105388108 [Plutella xylostella]